MNQQRILAYKMAQQLTEEDLAKVAAAGSGTHLITGGRDNWDIAYD